MNNWNTVATWSCGRVPANGDDVVIIAGGTTTLNVNSNSLLSLTVNGTLIIGGNLNVNNTAASFLTINGTATIGNSAAARAIVVTGNITVAGTFSAGATAATHTLTAGGDITNTGTINFAPSATRLCDVTFNRNGNQTVSGAGAYTFDLITLNMGATSANILDMQSAMTVPSPFLTITNGTYKHSNASNITPWTVAPTIPASGGFWLNGAATVTTTGFNVSVTGLFRVSAGTMTIGNTTTTQLILNNASTFQMDGGVLNVSGGLDSAATNSTGTFTMSAGSINLMTVGAGAVTSFMLGSGTTFNMSGGTITLVNGDNTTNDLELRSGTVNVTGGTLQIGSGATSAVNQFLLTNGTGVSFTVWNLTLAAGVARTTTLASAVNVLNSLTVQANNILDGGGFAINVGDATANPTPGIGNWINNGTYTTGTSTVSFVGPGAAAIGGTAATTFQNLTINKTAAANTVTVNTSPTVNATLTFTTGQIVTGANAVIVAAAATIATPSAASYVVGRFQKDYAAAANLSYFAGNDFPVGDAANYTPVNISSGTTTTAGSLTVSTFTPDHPQVATPIASTGIDAAKSVNRYWRFNNAGLTVGTAITSTFTFVAADKDVAATTANFIVERYDGTNWNPTALVAANPLNTQASNITPLAAGNNDFAVGEPFSGFNGFPGAFNVFEQSTPANAILGRVNTKIVGTAIPLSVVAVNAGRTGVNLAFAGTPITVDLLDARDNTGAITLASNCRPTWGTLISTQSIAVAWGGTGRVNINITAPANAARDVRVRVTQGANVGCSTDRFSIRPTGYTSVTSTMNNSGTSGVLILKTGQNFTISALTGLSGYDNGAGATLASPQIIPLIDNSTSPIAMVLGSPTAGNIGGAFGAASSGTATGASFFYSEVGNFGLSANAIYDNVFTAVDQPLDCTADFSNALVGGKYGCYFGSPAIALGSGFGRFTPDNFDVAYNLPAPQFGTACGTFTYVGKSFTYSIAPAITVTARNGTNNGLTNATTVNYAGAYMKFSNANVAPLSLNRPPYDTQNGRYSRFAALGAPLLDTSSLPATTADPVIGTFTSGVGTLTFSSGTGLGFIRTTPNPPFDADIALALNVIDTDGVAFAGNPASFGSVISAGNGIAFSSSKVMLFGRLRLLNALGSERLSLVVPMQTEYYTGAGFALNGADNCTTITNLQVGLGSYKQNLASGDTIVSITPVPGPFAGGMKSVTLSAPGINKNGSVDVVVNLAPSTTVNTCNTWSPSAPTPTGANMSYLRGNWCGANYDRDPVARANFGIYGSQPNRFIYQRENY